MQMMKITTVHDFREDKKGKSLIENYFHFMNFRKKLLHWTIMKCLKYMIMFRWTMLSASLYE